MQPDPNELPRLTDTYFLRTKEVVRRFGDREATYAVFMRRPVIFTPKLMVDYAETAEKRVKVAAMGAESAEVAAIRVLSWVREVMG